MFPDSILSRAAIRALILALDAVVPLSLVWIIAAHLCSPAPPAVVATTRLAPADAADFLLRYRIPFHCVTAWAALEVAWWIVARVGIRLLHRSRPSLSPGARISSEERWRLWKSMVESTEDPAEWLKSAFLPKAYRHAPRGADDPAFNKVKLETLGRTNIEEYVAHYMFDARIRDLKPRSLARSELDAMILLLEARMTLLRARTASSSSTNGSSIAVIKNSAVAPFRFLRGRSPHWLFNLADEPLRVGHHPLVFYVAMAGVAQLAYLALYFAGFRYYGGAGTWPFPLRFIRASTTSLEAALDPNEAARMGDPKLAARVGYWYKPASRQAQEDDAKPLVICHGISGTFVITPFLLYLSRLSGRAIFLPELPYVSMRLSPPSAILTRLEYVAAVRRMLWAHGFGLTCLERDEEDDDSADSVVGDEEEEVGGSRRTEDEEPWRRAKAIVLAHSFGTEAAAWLLRDAADIIAGTILVDPMSLFLHAADAPRSFFRTRSGCRTASELFFRYFALERGISHYLSRHLRWTDSLIFAGGEKPAAPLPERVVKALVPRCAQEALEPPFDVPNYAPFVTPCPAGPLPTVVFLSEKDCIVPVGKVRAYLEAVGFSTGQATATPPPKSLPPDEEASAATESAPDGELAQLEAVEEGTNEEKAASSATTALVQTNGSTHADSSAVQPPPPSLYIMPRFEHGAILARPAWCRRVKEAIDRVELAAVAWETSDDCY
ncbi:hypothetical protein JCM10908_004062 [Rhodotorula pacifica]|uniref:uncharacterized protein n=1 Tax=Rhodotorula pacifica TaxID=1495444 RepID=UPI003173464A